MVEQNFELERRCGLLIATVEPAGFSYEDKSAGVVIKEFDTCLRLGMERVSGPQQFGRDVLACSFGEVARYADEVETHMGTNLAGCIGITYPALARAVGVVFGIATAPAPKDSYGLIDLIFNLRNAREHARPGEKPWQYARPIFVCMSRQQLHAFSAK